jgi:hypothetical protein
MKIIATFALCFSLAMAAFPALASGGVMCDAEDGSIKFDFSAGQSRDGAGDWFGLQGSVVSKVGKLPAGLAKFDIKRENLTEHWADRETIRLQIEQLGGEEVDYANVRLTIIATALEELTYKGPYLLRIHQADGTDITRDGSVSCSAE